jgi:hypothetical protein
MGEPRLRRFPLERLNPSIQVTVGRSNQAFHIADLIADLPSNIHEFLRELLIQAGDSFGDQTDVGTQRLADDVEMSFELVEFAIRLVESPIRFLVHGADLPSKATDLASKATDLASQTADLAPQATDLAPQATDLAPQATDLAPQAADLAPQATDLAPQPFSHDVEMAFEIIRSPNVFLVHDADLAPKATDLAS